MTVFEPFRFLAQTMHLAINAIQFSGHAFNDAAADPRAQSAAILIAFLAGVSEMLGQSVILVVNRVALYRFFASLAFTGASYALTVVTWSLATLAVAPLTRVGVLGVDDFAAVTGVLALAFAPRLFGVFAIAPYFGAAFGNLLEVWAMALAMFGLHMGLGLPIGAAVFCAGAGFLVSYILRAFAGHALAGPLGRLQRAVAGSPLDKSPRQIIDDVMSRLSREANR